MNESIRVIAAIVFIAAFTEIPAAHATKPCQPSPCENAAGQFDRAKCRAHADWIAQGSVSNVTHHREGHPTNKDFAEFTFTARLWEKRAKSVSDVLRFTVGWCENRQELPARTTGMFRVFGISAKTGTSKEPRYIYLEPITEKAH